MMLHYLEVKKQYPDHIVFYRLGDFYEMFFDDAKTVSKELELTLTGRDCGEEERAPMCGVPFHAADTYIGKLVEKGYRIAVCEQVEDPSQAVGMVKREVVRIVTPGTMTDAAFIDADRSNYLCAVYFGFDMASCAFCDISSGTINVTKLVKQDNEPLSKQITNELSVFSPSEIIIGGPDVDKAFKDKLASKGGVLVIEDKNGYFSDDCERLTEERFENSAKELSYEEHKAAAAILLYLGDTQKTSVNGITRIISYTQDAFLSIDSDSRRNLELCETNRTKERKGSLLWVLDKTKTSAGARLLREYIEKPLTNCRAIAMRQNAVEELYLSDMLRDDIRGVLSQSLDTERILSKAMYGNINARDLRALGESLKIFKPLTSLLSACKCDELSLLAERLKKGVEEKATYFSEYLSAAFNDEPPVSVREGGMIRPGFSKQADELIKTANDTKSYLAGIENQEKELTGIKTLKIGYTKVFGYYIEVPNGSRSLVPERYMRKQTLVNAERYITSELKDMESRILSAKDRLVALEYEIFMKILGDVRDAYAVLKEAADIAAETDVYASLAEVAGKNNYVRPEVDYGDIISIKNGRHPVVEKFSDGFFVPNDTYMDNSLNRTSIITGPNMSGKSTYMRQVAVITLMAQIGSFVPAEEARIGIVDKIFTRIGAGDDLSGGNSTFMLEMKEVAYILRHATKKSLIIYDEIGRGTSTYDGMSIARAVLEYTTGKKLGAKTLFATHYHELSDLENTVEGVKNYNIAAKKRGDDVIFLRKIVPGSTDDSFGIEVARLAGVPGEVTKRAKQILAELEGGTASNVSSDRISKSREQREEISIFDAASDEIRDELKRLDVNTMTPIEAMGKLYELAKKAKES
ncbi:MAG: DNA mismatch repair protein MutS [Ruminococcaceae bacterium]|nr:DNA mismatch repair protein MutS [Oscillospiraceae bacterium]